jgi:hypothetical protein
MDEQKLRAWWFFRQGLTTIRGSSAEILARTGWARSVGGANPYLTLFARGGLGARQIEADLKNNLIFESPSARGCTYYVPAAHVRLALSLAKKVHEPISSAERALGITEAEIDKLANLALQALGEKELAPEELKPLLGDAVRNFGEEGKKRGVTTDLPGALMRLQVRGQIRRVSTNDRLDNQKFRYVRWDQEGNLMDHDDALAALANLYWDWIGPASLKNFQWFTSCSGKAATIATKDLDLVPVGDDLLIKREHLAEFDAFSAPTKPHYALVSSLDGMALLRRDSVALIDAADQTKKIFTSKGEQTASGLMDLPANPILDRGRVIGWWEFDPEGTGKICWRMFGDVPAGVSECIERTEAMIRDDLGDCRSFSLDSPASRRPLLDWLSGKLN